MGILFENEHELKQFTEELVKRNKVMELVKLMRPLDIAKVVAAKLDLCPKDVARTTLDLIRHAEGLCSPSIETNKEFPVPAQNRKYGKKLFNPKDLEEFLTVPSGKTVVSPRFTIQRHHFPPDPRGGADGFPYDDSTKVAMDPRNKGGRRPLTTGKDNTDGREWTKEPLKTDPKVRQPGGDGAGGGGIYQMTFHSRTGDMPGAGNRSWVAKGTKGWNSPPEKEFDNPDADNDQPIDKEKPPTGENMGGAARSTNLHPANAGDEEDKPDFMRTAPVGASIPTTNYGGRTPATNMGYRGYRRR